jgi:hypothetical protein
VLRVFEGTGWVRSAYTAQSVGNWKVCPRYGVLIDLNVSIFSFAMDHVLQGSMVGIMPGVLQLFCT